MASPPRGVFTRDQLTGPTSICCDVVVVGSGAGGATVAAELAEAGLDVVIVEEGRYYQTQDFTGNASAMVRALYRDGGATLALGRPNVLYQEGRTVGGSTVVNGAMSWRTPERVLARWQALGVEHMSTDAMAPFFDRVERRINVAPQPDETVGRDNRLFRQGAEAKGWRVVKNRRSHVHCAGSNNCAFGCPTGAKQSALVSYIPRALHFGARILSDVRITKILHRGQRAIGVQGHTTTQHGGRGTRVRVRAKLVIIACGAVHTPMLLRRSGFRSPSRMVGHHLSMHPNCKVVAQFDTDVRGWEGVHQAYQVREFEHEGLVFAAVNVPPGILAMTMANYGTAMKEQMSNYKRWLVAGILLEDTSRGRVRVPPIGPPIVTYQLNDYDAQRLKRGTILLCELLLAAGARTIHLPFAGVTPITSPDQLRTLAARDIPKRAMELVTVHVMGTARMGRDRNASVTNSFGRVHDTTGLFVCDASLFPSPIGINPAETIQALATRTAAHVLERQHRYIR